MSGQFTAGWLAGRDAALAVAKSYAGKNRFAVNDAWKEDQSPSDVYNTGACDVGMWIEAEIRALTPPVPASDAGESPAPVQRKWRHKKIGTIYAEIARAELYDASFTVCDGDDLVIYRDEDGKLWARRDSEFENRFEAITP